MRARFINSSVVVWFAVLVSTLSGQGIGILDQEQHLQPGIVVRITDEARRVVDRIVFKSSEVRGEISWSGFLESEAEGDYRFAATFVGDLRISLDGRIILNQVAEKQTWVSSEPIRLDYDWHALRIWLKPAADSRAVSLNVQWQGPRFRFEPIPAKSLGHIDNVKSDPRVARGRDLTRVLRCEACHVLGRSLGGTSLRSPDLTNASEHLREPWLRQFLSAESRRQESDFAGNAWTYLHGKFNQTEVSEVIAFLASLATSPAQPFGSAPGDAGKGRELFLTLGCLACHRYNELGRDNMFGGGDLSHVASKRPPGSLRQWLVDPENVNADYRMPEFQLSNDELIDLSTFLSADAMGDNASTQTNANAAVAKRGRQLIVQHQCTSCHTIGSLGDSTERTPIDSSANWSHSCLQSNGMRQPDYGLLQETDRDAITRYVQTASDTDTDTLLRSRQLIAENSCFECHARGALPGLFPTIQQIIEKHAGLVAQLPRMRPPSLNSVGDKLHNFALRDAIARKGPKHRTWLSVRMPKFRLASSQIDQIADYFAVLDRVPDEAAATDSHDLLRTDALQGADRLVTSDGFGCTSCHAIGKVRPPSTTPLNQLGPGLAGLGKRIRKAWFHRWVRNPARIVPKMEMPSVQVGLPSFLGGDVDRQLNVVWQLLNLKGFSPPDPNPVRVAFRSGNIGDAAIVLTDVLRIGSKKLVKPFLIGLPNRHNVLIDLAEGRLAGWWTGDTAKQRTQGKSWFWEAPLFDVQVAPERAEFLLLRQEKQHRPQRVGQFIAEVDGWANIKDGVELKHRLHFISRDSSEPHTIHITQSFVAVDGGWKRRISARGLEPGDVIAMRSSGLESSTDQALNGLHRLAAEDEGHAVLELEYISSEEVAPASAISEIWEESISKQLEVMPGFRATRLPLRNDVMPTALTWRPSGELVIASLKGRVWEATDTNSDQLEDTLRVISDDLAAPYGLYAGDSFVDVLNKYGLIRLHDENNDGRADHHEIVASGWGHTDDYHDWVVGLPKDAKGNYYVAIPCQQDDRSEAAAHLRGKVLRLAPRQHAGRGARRFELEIMTGGHRFPMGIALNQLGDLFVTDNQGNYNPFNELNHVVKGARYGFINKQELAPGFAPKLTPPAIDIPHPWTRSVNGICFLETPPKMPQRLYGPFEGHLIGCEYDTRRLIRMSLEEVDGWIQGAAYPLAEAAMDPEDGLQGPINCAIAADGDIYIANIRDSGWGGANNTGSLVRIVPKLDELPTGISVVKALPSGFRIDFTRPVERSLAAAPERYAISSYRRISTPTYGGDDVDLRREQITKVHVAEDASSVELELENIRTGFVYEFHLKSLVTDAQSRFFPAEAFYTLRRRPTR